jgi:hypothetical protein
MPPLPLPPLIGFLAKAKGIQKKVKVSAVNIKVANLILHKDF